MNQALRAVIAAAGLLGAICFVAVEAMILYQLGGQFAPYVPRSADEFAGYLTAASAFLALAYTFAADEHIRVTLVLDHVDAPARAVLERVAVTVATALAAYLAWYVCQMAWGSWQYGERSAGLIALPLWIPQAAMAFGAVTFFLALVERAWRVWSGKKPELPSGVVEVHRADR